MTVNWLKIAAYAAAIGSALLVFNMIINVGACHWYGHETSREVRYSPYLGCTVKINGAYVPRSELRVVQ